MHGNLGLMQLFFSKVFQNYKHGYKHGYEQFVTPY